MIVTRLSDAKPYAAPLHTGVASMFMQGAEPGGSALNRVAISYYLPGGKAEMSAGETEKVYVVLDGALTLEMGDGSTTVLERLDSCLIEAGESREVRNETNETATLLVIMPKPA